MLQQETFSFVTWVLILVDVQRLQVVSATAVSPTWETVKLNTSFSAAPVVLSQLQTADGELFLSTRQRMVSGTQFEVALEPEELREMVTANAIQEEQVAAVFFTTTTDLNAEFPAVAARKRTCN